MPADFRHEYKYLCDNGQLRVEQARLESLLQPDPHAGPAGRYAVRSVYFDDLADSCLLENEDGSDPRAKYRLRIYNGSDRRISLERKAKHSPLLRRMLTDMRLRVLEPKVIVQYTRTPFVLETGNVRITLDEQIASSQAVDRFLEGEIPLRQVLPAGQGVLEVKWDELLPSWVGRSLQLDGLQWTAFSKYYLCRIYNTMGGVNL